jgi:hypothetical protein
MLAIAILYSGVHSLLERCDTCGLHDILACLPSKCDPKDVDMSCIAESSVQYTVESFNCYEGREPYKNINQDASDYLHAERVRPGIDPCGSPGPMDVPQHIKSQTITQCGECLHRLLLLRIREGPLLRENLSVPDAKSCAKQSSKFFARMTYDNQQMSSKLDNACYHQVVSFCFPLSLACLKASFLYSDV